MSIWVLGLITIGIGWLVSRLFLVVDLIDGKERD